jgi:hypothetical protein
MNCTPEQFEKLHQSLSGVLADLDVSNLLVLQLGILYKNSLETLSNSKNRSQNSGLQGIESQEIESQEIESLDEGSGKKEMYIGNEKENFENLKKLPKITTEEMENQWEEIKVKIEVLLRVMSSPSWTPTVALWLCRIYCLFGRPAEGWSKIMEYTNGQNPSNILIFQNILRSLGDIGDQENYERISNEISQMGISISLVKMTNEN